VISVARLAVVCVAIAGWGFGFGVGTQVLSLWAKQRDASESLIGWLHAAYYLGVAAAAVFVPLLARRWGLRTVLAGMALSVLTLAVFPWSRGPVDWFVLRTLAGAGCALTVIPLETLLSLSSPSEKRTEIFGWYGFAITLGGAIGVAMGTNLHPETPSSSPLAMLVGSLGPLLGFVLISVGLDLRTPLVEEASDVRVPIGPNILPFGAAWGLGFVEGGLIGFLTLYLIHLGYSQDFAGIMLGATVIGILAFQVPASMLGDRFGPLRVLLGCFLISIAGLLIAPFLKEAWPLVALLCIFGGAVGALYPLGLSLLGRNTPPGGQPKAYSIYLGIECIGSVVGAAATGHAREPKRWGQPALFYASIAALVAVLVLWLASEIFVPKNKPKAAE